MEDFIRQLKAGEFDEEIDAYLKTSEFAYYNQPYFRQWKMNDKGEIVFTDNGEKLITRAEFS